jgi:hypothetical protein
MWNNEKAYVSFISLQNSFITVANNVRIKCEGSETIRIKMNNKILQIHDIQLKQVSVHHNHSLFPFTNLIHPMMQKDASLNINYTDTLAFVPLIIFRYYKPASIMIPKSSLVVKSHKKSVPLPYFNAPKAINHLSQGHNIFSTLPTWT